MSEYTATIVWERGAAVFVDNRYSREHVWRFDGGAEVPASSSPSSVPVPLSNPVGVDPEEAFVAALSSCHMLWFLSLAAKAGWLVESYADTPVGYMDKNSAGRLAMQRVVLRPDVRFGGDPPGAGALRQLHDRAHHECYLANSVLTAITVELPQGQD
jgi:organic hydroperoxide reductase OsmC/OhrA